MKKKSIVMIFIIIILILFIGFMSYAQFNSSEEHVQVGDVNFTIPSGFYKGTPNSQGDINLTDGNVSIYIANYDGNNIEPFVVRYQENVYKTNNTVTTSNFTIDNIKVCKSVNDGTGSEHYWFVKNKKVYSVYVWQNYTSIDNTIFDLIKSTDDTS